MLKPKHDTALHLSSFYSTGDGLYLFLDKLSSFTKSQSMPTKHVCNRIALSISRSIEEVFVFTLSFTIPFATIRLQHTECSTNSNQIYILAPSNGLLLHETSVSCDFYIRISFYRIWGLPAHSFGETVISIVVFCEFLPLLQQNFVACLLLPLVPTLDFICFKYLLQLVSSAFQQHHVTYNRSIYRWISSSVGT